MPNANAIRCPQCASPVLGIEPDWSTKYVQPFTCMNLACDVGPFLVGIKVGSPGRGMRMFTEIAYTGVGFLKTAFFQYVSSRKYKSPDDNPNIQNAKKEAEKFYESIAKEIARTRAAELLAQKKGIDVSPEDIYDD